MSAGPLRLGFLGAGWIADRALAPATHAADDVVLQAVAARSPERAAALGPAGRVHESYEALLDDDDVDAVYVCLTNEQHKPWTLAALAAGKHVLCEKPLGLDLAEVRELHAAADDAGLVLLEGFFYRWHPRMRRLVELVRSGGLGDVHGVASEFSFDGGGEERMAGNYRLDPARGGGALYDVGVYPLSAAHALVGPGLEVTQAQARYGPTGVDLDVHAVLTGPGGSRVEARCAIDGREGQSLRVDGAAATVETGEGEAFTAWHAPSSLILRTPDGAVREEHFAPVDAYRLMVEAFAARILDGVPLLVTPQDSLDVAATVEQVRTAALG